MWNAFVTGLVLASSLIVAIGAQNAFVLRQGVIGRHVGSAVGLCILGDVILILLGCFGLGSLIAGSKLLLTLARYLGAAFVGLVGLKFVYEALRSEAGLSAETGGASSLKTVALSAFGFSLLNPHAIMDTVVMLGTLSSRYSGAPHLAFTGAAILVSAVWFSLLGFGARLFAPVLARAENWQIFNAAMGIFMLYLSAQILAG